MASNSTVSIRVKLYTEVDIRRIEICDTVTYSDIINKFSELYTIQKDKKILVSYLKQIKLEKRWQCIENQQGWSECIKDIIAAHNATQTSKGPTLILNIVIVDQEQKSGKNSNPHKSMPHKLRGARSIVQGLRPAAPWPQNIPEKLPPVITTLSGARKTELETWELVDDDDFDESETKTENKTLSITLRNKAINSTAVIPHKHNTTYIKHELPAGLRAIYSDSISFSVNGDMRTLTNVDPMLLVVDYLRYACGLTGTKIGCGEGGCGACTIVITRTDATGAKVSYSARSCLMPVCQLDGANITTDEGLGSVASGLHPIQQRIADNHGSQCGYCTNGFVMSMYGLLSQYPTPTKAQVEAQFDGNLCRCTGYRPIFTAMRTFAPNGEEKHLESNHESKCCASTDKDHDNKMGCSGVCSPACATANNCNGCDDIEDMCCKKDALRKSGPYEPALFSPKFPDELLSYTRKPYYFVGDTHMWFSPLTLPDVYTVLAQYTTQPIRLVVGNTSIGVVKYYPTAVTDNPNIFIDLSKIPDLNTVTTETAYLRVGAAVTLHNLLLALEAAQTASPTTTTIFSALLNHIRVIANVGVRNVASWAGNLMTAHTHTEFPSDLLTTLSSIGAMVCISTAAVAETWVNVIDFQAYTLPAQSLITSIRIPFNLVGKQAFDSYKIRNRKQNSHPIINAAFNIIYTDTVPNPSAVPTIQSITVVYGGLKPGLTICANTSKAIAGQPLNAATLQLAITALDTEAAANNVPTGVPYLVTSPAYRHSLALTVFYRFFLTQIALYSPTSTIPTKIVTVTQPFVRDISSGTQSYTPVSSENPVSYPIVKLEAYVQASGEAKYTDCIPSLPNTLYAAYVYSQQSTGTIVSIDATAALAMAGVVKFISAGDIAKVNGTNNCGSFPGDEEIFASTTVTCVGQGVGLILADTQKHADAAAKAVVVTYSNPTTPLYTIEDAIAAKSFFPDNQYIQNPPPVTCGDLIAGFAASDFVIQGVVNSAAQYHFYFETQASYAIPEENNSLILHNSSQGTAAVRAALLTALNMPANKVIVTTKRAGGAFGGKLSRNFPLACAVSVAARLLNRPVRSQCNRNMDIDMWGKRHPTQAQYKLGFSKAGKIIAYQTTFYTNGGHTYEDTLGVMSMCLQWSDNTYYIPNFSATGVSCRTNIPSNTAMRSPGAMQAIFAIENMIDHIARTLQMDPKVVREANFYTQGQTTPYGMPIDECTIQACWNNVITQSDYATRKAAVDSFNSTNRWRKRGIHVTPCKYPMGLAGGYTTSVTVNVHSDDGTIIVSHTGAEIGQGINTKVAQCVAYSLGVDISMITVGTNSTEIIANGTETGGSGTSESVCAAALNACVELNARLQPIREKNPGKPWAAIAGAAYAGNVNLCVNGYFSQPGGEFPFDYFVFAASCTEVELDVLTGDIQIIRTDIVYDCGNSLNPAVDIGQIEGGFVQALGYLLWEEVVTDTTTGKIINNGTWDYHPASSQDIPIQFNVTLLGNTPNTCKLNVLGSKASAEPPLQLACSAFFALKDAIYAARADAGNLQFFQMDAPATIDKIQQYCLIDKSQLTMNY